MEQATGPRKEELDDLAIGRERFERSPIYAPHDMGSQDDPVLVPSQVSLENLRCILVRGRFPYLLLLPLWSLFSSPTCACL